MEAVAQAGNPWRSIWIRPRETVRYLVQRGPGPMVLVLAALGGISQFLDRASIAAMGDTYTTSFIVLLAILLGPALGIIGLYIGGWLFAWTGRWIGGQGSAPDVRIALAWATVPVVFGLLVWMFNLAVIGGDLFTTYMPGVEARPILAIVMMFTGLITIALGIWSLVIMLHGIAEVHGFSAWKALGTVLLGLVPLFGLVFVIGIVAAIMLPAVG